MNSATLKIALFGTSADPPTTGHEIILKELAQKYNLVITYASNNPSKKHQENLFDRSLLLKTLIENINDSKVIFDGEISSPWAIRTIKMCKAKYNIERVDFVIGSDLLEEMFYWKNFDEILNEVKLYIIPRQGYQIHSKSLNSIKKLNGIFEISTLKIPKVSSSLIRSNYNCSYVPKSLIAIIKNKKLYKKI